MSKPNLVAVLALWLLLGPARAEPWTRHTIDDSSRGADGVRLADVNADGLPDIATAWEEGGQIRVYLNPGPAAAKRPWPAVTVGRVPTPEDAVLVDLDGDGAVDVVSCCEAGQAIYIHWAPRGPDSLMNALAWRTEPVTDAVGRSSWLFALPLDVDGRGGTDLVVGSNGSNAMIGWLQSPPDAGSMASWKLRPLYQAGWIMSLVAIDMDNDRDRDVLASDRSSKSPGVLWLENPGPERCTETWPEHRIGPPLEHVMFLDAADLDGDGLIDIVAPAMERNIHLLFQPAGAHGDWKLHTLQLPPGYGTSKAARVADLNLDGRLDLAVTCSRADGPISGVLWLERDAQPTAATWTAHDIGGSEGTKFDLLELLDLDADGDLDLLTCEETDNLGVVWYENPVR